jgi:hypothetical protein
MSTTAITQAGCGSTHQRPVSAGARLPHRPVVTERIECSPVRATLSRHLIFEPA